MAVLVVTALVLAACSRTSPPRVSVSQKTTKSHIIFVSDQSVILSRSGATYHFVAHVKSESNQVVHEAILWHSSAPDQVSVTQAGVATARTTTGSATITVRASGAQAQVAQVTVAQPAPGTVLIPSSDVLAVSLSGAKLKVTPQTQAIKAGETLVSDNRGGLLAKVTAVTTGSGSVELTTTPAGLAQAFIHLSIHAKGAPVPTRVPTKDLHGATTAERSRPGVAAGLADVATGARILPAADTSQGSSIDCTLSSGAGVTVSLAGPSVSIPATVQLVGVLQTSFLTVDQFELAVQATVPVVVNSGSVTVSAAGNADATCDLNVPTIDIPTPIFIGPVEINGNVDPTAGVDLSVDAGGSMTFAGPTVSDTANALDGIEYTSGGGWQAVEDNSQTGTQVTPAGSKFDASLATDASPDLRVDFGISAVLGDCDIDLCTTLAGANLAFAEAKGSFNFQIASPFSDVANGYAGPTWKAGVEFTAGPEFVLTGDIVDLFAWIGVTPPDVQWSVFDDKVPLAGSPAITLTANPASGGSVKLAASVPTGFSGDTVKFVAYPSTGADGTIVATTTVAGTSATTNWTPTTSTSGSTYQVTALLFDNVFGSAGLPYASTAAPVTVGSGTSTTTTTTSSTTPTPTVTAPQSTAVPNPNGSTSSTGAFLPIWQNSNSSEPTGCSGPLASGFSINNPNDPSALTSSAIDQSEVGCGWDSTGIVKSIWLHSGSSISYSFTVPVGASEELKYGIPSDQSLNNAPAVISGVPPTSTVCDGGVSPTDCSNLPPFHSTASADEVLWTSSPLSAGTYTVTIASDGDSVNVYGVWIVMGTTP